ncbi:MAG: HypC/HybG/HupF family hydrogenase formation chaperone [Gammaproteobacteria bacterium]
MCVGIPMKVVESDGLMAWCEGRGRREQLNMMLVGPQAPGTWVLAFVGSAREVLTEEQAAQIDDALDAVEAVMRGETDISGHFRDLQRDGPES